MNPESSQIPELAYAFTDNGIELPVLDITHPQFLSSIDEDHLDEVSEASNQKMLAMGQMSDAQRGTYSAQLLKSYIYGRVSVSVLGASFMSGMSTYVYKLGPNLIGGGREREFDRFTQDFLARNPEAVVVHIGCGLDARFERVAEGSQVEWYDLDLPEVIELRRRLVGAERGRHHLLACSVLDSGWLSEVGAHRPRPFLFLAEGVFMYFCQAQVKSLVLALHEQFPGAELVFDAYSPFLMWSHNLRVTRKRIGAHLHWALKRPQDLEGWSDPSTLPGTGGIRLLDESYPFQSPEPRIRRALKIRLVPFVAKGIGVSRYQL